MFNFFVLFFAVGISTQFVHSQCVDRLPVILNAFKTSVITSPDLETGSYAPNTSCSWVIKTSEDTPQAIKILVQIDILEIKCPGDYLRVYSGESSAGPKIYDEYRCFPDRNTTLQFLISSPAFVEFHSDEDDMTGIGFKMQFLAANDSSGDGCDNVDSLLAEESEQFLSSPGFPDDYPLNSECRWNITANESLFVEVKLYFMDIDNDDNCTYHRLEIKTDDEEISLCERREWRIRTFTGETVNIYFKTDSKNKRSGFLIGYISVLATTGPSTTKTTPVVPKTTHPFYWDYWWNDQYKPFPDYYYWDTWTKPTLPDPLTTTPRPNIPPRQGFFDHLVDLFYLNWLF